MISSKGIAQSSAVDILPGVYSHDTYFYFLDR